MEKNIYLIKILGVKELIERFTETVAIHAWIKLTDQIQQNDLFSNGQCQIEFVSNSEHYLLISHSQQSANYAQSIAHLMKDTLENILGITANRIIKVEIFSGFFQPAISLEKQVFKLLEGQSIELIYQTPGKASGELLEILDNESIQSYLQPIFNLETLSVVGYETLTRGPDNSSLFSADNLFREASNQGVSYELELLCFKKALEIVPKLDQDIFITANINPHYLGAPHLLNLCTTQSLNGQFKIELTEHLPIDDWEELRRNMRVFEQNGIDFWLDDAGCGYFGLETIEEVKPRVVKLCITLLNHLQNHDDIIPDLRKVVEQVHSMGGIVLAEGVETQRQEDILKELSIDLVQGYFYAKPAKSTLVLNTKYDSGRDR